MPYTPSNPYIPGDPYSYDLKWIVEKLKEAISLYEPLNTQFEQLGDDFDDLYNYVHDYFANLDLTSEVEAIIYNMETDGTLRAIITSILNDSGDVQTTITNWLNDNVTPVGSAVVVDNSLTISGAAADALTVGDKFISVQDKFEFTRIIPHKIIDENTSFPSNNIYVHDGNFHSYTNFKSTDFIDISEYSGKEFIFTLFGFNRIVGGTPVQVDSVSFFDNAQVYISGFCYPYTTTSSGIRYDGVAEIPSNAKYARFVYNTTQSFDPAVYVANAGVKRLKIACVGDSLTQGMYRPVGQHYEFVSDPYPTVLKNVLNDNELYFVETLNYGRRGLSPLTYWNDAIPPTGQYNSPDPTEPGDAIAFDPSINVCIIMLGTNGNLTNNTIAQDTNISPGQTYYDYANTHCGDYCKIIEYIMEKTDNKCSIILAVPPYTDDPTYKTKIEGSIDTIKALAERYSIPIINPFYEAGINTFNKDVFMYTGDYVHMTQLGYDKLGQYIANQMLSYMDPLDLPII